MHFVAGQNAGVTVIWSGGSTVVAHRGSGLAALFTKTFPLSKGCRPSLRPSPEVVFRCEGESIQIRKDDVDHVHLIAVTLEQIGPPPWTVALDDLETIADVLSWR